MIEAGPIKIKEKCRDENQGDPAVVTPVVEFGQALKAQSKGTQESTGKEDQVSADNRTADDS